MVSRPRVLIRTLPLQAGNYGGIVQAWAMQQVLQGMGLSAATDVSERRVGRPPLAARAKSFAKKTILDLPLVRIDNPGLTSEHLKPRIDARLRRFVDENLATTSVFDGADVRTGVLDDYDGFLVGSDQVWRARWSDIRSYLFDFLATEDPRPRISYAASFGKDDLTEYSAQLVHDAAALAARMTALSVRESSGVDICRDQWGVAAEVHVDPTMLLERSSYQRLYSTTSSAFNEPTLLSYVLDKSARATDHVDHVASLTGLSVRSMSPEVPRTIPEFRRDPDRFTRPGVPDWLAAFEHADFVVTDSFHGTVFAILNNTPFLTIINRSRGASRFDSLLGRLSLAHRMIDPADNIPEELIAAPINWSEVNERLAHERDRGLTFLRSAFASLIDG